MAHQITALITAAEVDAARYELPCFRENDVTIIAVNAWHSDYCGAAAAGRTARVADG